MSVQITTELNWYLMYLCWFLLDISISNLCEFFLLSTVTVDNCPDGPSFYPHGGSHVTITHGALELIVQGTPWPWPSWTWDFWGPLPQPPPTSDIWWSPLGTCSNLFTSGPSPMGLTSGGNWNRYGQGKQAVHIILKCFLVNFKIHLIQVIRKKKINLGGGVVGTPNRKNMTSALTIIRYTGTCQWKTLK